MNRLRFAAAEALLQLTQPQAITPATVHLWAYRIDTSPDVLAEAHALLSAQEQARAARFAFERHRSRYSVAHGVMRKLLGLYCQVSPRDLAFETNVHGKPRITTVCESPRSLSFNLSHSQDRALLGVSDGRAIGIDLEQERAEIDALGICESYFFGGERDSIKSTVAADRVPVFFRYWVAKEAVLKAEGTGLGIALDQFAVEFDSPGTANVLATDPRIFSAEWRVKMIPMESGWAAAVSAADAGWTTHAET